MPICERDPWRFQFFETTPCPSDVFIPTDDPDSWDWYPEYRWIYHKLNIARSQGIRCGPHDDIPAQFPVFSKPAINLKGMGIDARVLYSRADFDRYCTTSNMWMELLSGPHISTDYAIENGVPRWCRHATGLSWNDGMFKFWVIHSTANAELETFLNRWIERHMAGYTGMMNFETIGGKIIETHLRFADQWCDLYGKGWTDPLVNLYSNGKWRFDDPDPTEGFSIPLFAKHGGPFSHPPAAAQARIRAMPHVSSLQITFHETKKPSDHAMPTGGFRLGIVNTTNLEAGFAARKVLARSFPTAQVMIPE